MSVTLDTSHLEISTLNAGGALSNKLFISVTAETSQDPIGPCGPLEQSEDDLRHSSMAVLRSPFDFGVNTAVVAVLVEIAVVPAYTIVSVMVVVVVSRRGAGE